MKKSYSLLFASALASGCAPDDAAVADLAPLSQRTVVQPALVYHSSGHAQLDSYSVSIVGQRIGFGDLLGLPGDGRVVFFDAPPASGTVVVDESDAALTVAGAPGQASAFGIVQRQSGGYFCAGADYYDVAGAEDAGLAYCFERDLVAGNELGIGDASFVVHGTGEFTYSTLEEVRDLDDDGFPEIIAYNARGLHVIQGENVLPTGEYAIPRDVDTVLGRCAGSVSDWCGFGRGVGIDGIVISGEGGAHDLLRFYDPRHLTAPARAAVEVSRDRTDNVAVAEFGADLFAVASTTTGQIRFFDAWANSFGTLKGKTAERFGDWVAAGLGTSGSLLAVGAPHATGGGVVYVFDLEQGIPSSTSDAAFVLPAPAGSSNCGSQVAIGQVDVAGTPRTVVAVACGGTNGSGGAAYYLP
jgi:hypothetical protein